jgi:ribonuclease T2
MRHLIAALCLVAAPALAQGERAGAFGYYVLALSWSPTWCALEGDARGSDQCADGTGFGFVLHGLWPQYEQGWPSDCPTRERDATRRQTAAMADIMGTAGSAWHQWRKHGRCSGLSAADYFALARLAYERIVRPDALRALGRPVTLPAAVVEEAFLDANPDLSAEGVTVLCREGRLREVRVCLTRDLDPRPCAPDVGRDCRMRDALLDPVR